jgi:hypothetical protein
MSVEDILIGPARLFHAPAGEAHPDPNTVAYGADWGGLWVYVGMTEEDTPVSWNREIERAEVYGQQVNVKLKELNTKEKLALETTLMELTGDNLALALDTTASYTPAGVGQVGLTEIKGGGKLVPTVRQYAFEGPYILDSGAILPVRFFLHRGTIVVGGALEFGKSKPTGLALRVDALGDLSQADDELLFHIQIVTAEATG